MIAIAFAIPELDRGGPDRVIAEVVTRLDRARFAPSLLMTKRGGREFDRIPADVPIELVAGRYPTVPAVRALRRRSPDAVLATQRMILALGLAKWALPRRTKLILRQANDVSADFDQLVGQSLVKHRAAKQLLLLALRHADAVICQSEAMRRDLTQLLGRSDHLHVIPNPIELGEITPTPIAGTPALVSVGRLMPQKGFDILLPALAQVRATYPGVHLTVLGDGPDRAALEAQARGLPVTFAGQVASPLPYVRGADRFVLASRYEGFSNAALEALAVGTPIVLTDCPGASAEMVRPGENGRLATSVTPAAMATAILASLADTYDPARIRADCQARYGSAHVVAEYERVISTVVRGT